MKKSTHSNTSRSSRVTSSSSMSSSKKKNPFQQHHDNHPPLYEEEYEDAPVNQGLLNKKRKKRIMIFHDHRDGYTGNRFYYNVNNDDDGDGNHFYGVDDNDDRTTNNTNDRRREWMRPYWLGFGLFFILFAFWLLDSLKDPIFARLVDGNLDIHQPRAKLVSVITTLLLVCFMEYSANVRRKKFEEEQAQAAAASQQQQQEQQQGRNQDDILHPTSSLSEGGIWTRMSIQDELSANKAKRQQQQEEENAMDDTVSISIFFQIGIPYTILFTIIAYLIYQFEIVEQQQQKQAEYGRVTDMNVDGTLNALDENNDESLSSSCTSGCWYYYCLAYALYATVESFGSIAVATFWSYTNSTLSLDDAERYYGPIIAVAQLGAIGGSTLVAADHWTSPTLLVVVSLVIVLHMILMKVYDRKFPPTSSLVPVVSSSTTSKYTNRNNNSVVGSNYNNGNDDDNLTISSYMTWQQDNNATITKPFWSGLYLIFRHNYILLIMGVSCTYEITLTLLDYQMKLLGLEKFDLVIVDSPSSSSFNDDDNNTSFFMNDGDGSSPMTTTTTTTATNPVETISSAAMSFSEFMGRYGQAVNIMSLLFSSIIFPWLIRTYGLRVTLRIFPTTLVIVTMITYGAVPGNLSVLFVSLSILKAMTYSIHDPSKEILYIPTSNAVKLRTKFWIDVVGERISKAIGSTINNYAGTVDRSVRIGTIPSIISSIGLWVICYIVGLEFDRLLRTGKIVGLDQSSAMSTYRKVPKDDESQIQLQELRQRQEQQEDIRNTNNDIDTEEPSEVEFMYGEDSISTLDIAADDAFDESDVDTQVA